MKRMPFKRPTTHYDERVKQIDEQLCELIKQRKEISDNNPGYPPFEYISNWAEKFDLYEDLLKYVFSSLWGEQFYRPFVEPEGFLRNLPVLKSIEIDNRLFSIISISQYSNASIVNFNIDWDSISDSPDRKSQHIDFELSIGDGYDCRMINGSGGEGHLHYNFTVSPSLPDDFSGIELIFKQYNLSCRDKPVGNDIVIQL